MSLRCQAASFQCLAKDSLQINTTHTVVLQLTVYRRKLTWIIQGESLARGPKLLSIKNYVIEIMTWKFIYIYRERCKTGPAHNRCSNWSPSTSKDTGMRFSKFWNTFPKVSTLTAWISWRRASLSCSNVRDVFLYTLPFNRPQRKKSAGVRPLVSNFVSIFRMQHFDGARLSPNSEMPSGML